MKENILQQLSQAIGHWDVPEIPKEMALGDMPGDKVDIVDGHIQKANLIFPELLALLKTSAEEGNSGKIVVAVGGGSGVGKSGIAALLSYYLKEIGIGSYTMSGDNYPHRIPCQNDAERLRIFRVSWIRGLMAGSFYTEERRDKLMKFQQEERDADPHLVSSEP